MLLSNRLHYALLVVLVLSSLFVVLAEHEPLSVISQNPPSMAFDSNLKFAKNKRAVMATFANDGGASTNNGSTDNGNWEFYGIGDQVGVNALSDLVYTYSRYVEKTVHVLTNWARMSPSGFKTRFLNLFQAEKSLETTGLPPLFEHFNLVESGRFHSKDMATVPCFQHNSCDGTLTFTRVATFYTKPAAMAENIAAGQTSPLSVTMAWINSDGHRANILGSSYTLLGVGHYPKVAATGFSDYWTQNFASGSHGISNPIVAATHITFATDTVTFLANYYHKADLGKGVAPLSVSIFINDVEYPMSIPASSMYTDSSLNAGTFEYNTTRLSSGTACRKYYIKAVDSNGYKYYYPSVGYLLTQGENSACTSNYLRAVRPGETPSCTGVNNCNGNGDCLAINTCLCKAGYKGSTCNQYSCNLVSNCMNRGQCTGPNVCTCQSGYTGASCNTPTCTTLNNCNGNGTCTSPNVCTCKSGYTGSDCNVFDCSSKGGCGFGQCTGPNICTCPANYVYGSCDLSFDAVISSPTFTSGQTVYTPGSMDIVFKSTISSLSAYSSLSYKWTQVSGTAVNLETISVAGTDKKDLAIKANSLIEGSTYTFRLNATRVSATGSVSVSKDLKITINRSPTISSFKVVNATSGLEISSALAVKTSLRASLVATDPESFTMLYSFGYYTQENSKVYVAELSASSTSPTFTLPTFSSGQVTIFFAVRDAAFTTVEKTKVLTIQDPTTTMSAQEVSSLVNSLISSTSLSSLEIANSLLNSKLTTTEKTSIRSNILTQIIASTDSDTAKIGLLERLTNQPSEITSDTAQKTLNLLLSISTSLKQNLQSTDRTSIVKTVSQLVSTVSTSNSNFASQLKKVIDASQVGAAMSLVDGQSSVSVSNLVKTAVVKSTIDNFNFSPSQIGLSSLSLPKDSLKKLLSSKYQLDSSASVSISLSIISQNIYSHIKTDLVSSIISINILSNGTELEISDLTSPIEFEVDISLMNSTMMGLCQFYNTQSSQFSSIGLESIKISNTRVKCRTVHLTDFAISPTLAQQSVNQASSSKFYFIVMFSLILAFIFIQ